MRRNRSGWLGWGFLGVAGLAGACCARGNGPIDASDVSSEDPLHWSCTPGQTRCVGNLYQICRSQGEFTTVETHDCMAELGPGAFCVEGVGCSPCFPGTTQCDGENAELCDDSSGSPTWVVVDVCDEGRGLICVRGMCENSCDVAVTRRSNVGCEYWGVDLDNADINNLLDAAAQQFAIIVSNPSRSTAMVTIEENDAPLGMPPSLVMVAQRPIPPNDLEVFLLAPREVDGSPPGTFNSGTHTAVTPNAYRVTSNFPVVAYQFNPLDNVNVFSNDASLLIPTSGLGTDYMVMAWPQTIAPDPSVSGWDIHLRTFLTIVGTSTAPTTVNVTLATDVVGDPAQGIPTLVAGDTLTYTLNQFDVLNLETSGFNADFTGSTIRADNPVAVYSGSEASDVPYFSSLSERQCCADHLEEQLWPEQSSGRTFVAARQPSRTAMVAAAGGRVAVVNEPEYYRALGLFDGTNVTTTLPSTNPASSFTLNRGESRTIRADQDFELSADQPIVFADFMSSQDATGISSITRLPGGDPSFILVPPTDQFRKTYVFLTPDKYIFDSVVIIARPGTQVLLDNATLPDTCTTSAAAPAGDWNVIRCQFSFPIIDDSVSPPVIMPGIQNDGVHTIDANAPVGVIVSGFDSYVSYGYPGGTDLAFAF